MEFKEARQYIKQLDSILHKCFHTSLSDGKPVLEIVRSVNLSDEVLNSDTCLAAIDSIASWGEEHSRDQVEYVACRILEGDLYSFTRNAPWHIANTRRLIDLSIEPNSPAEIYCSLVIKSIVVVGNMKRICKWHNIDFNKLCSDRLDVSETATKAIFDYLGEKEDLLNSVIQVEAYEQFNKNCRIAAMWAVMDKCFPDSAGYTRQAKAEFIHLVTGGNRNLKSVKGAQAYTHRNTKVSNKQGGAADVEYLLQIIGMTSKNK